MGEIEEDGTLIGQMLLGGDMQFGSRLTEYQGAASGHNGDVAYQTSLEAQGHGRDDTP